MAAPAARIALAAALALAACQKNDTVPPPEAVVADSAPTPPRAPLPLLVTVPHAPGGPVPLAIIHGILDFAGPCVRVQDPSNHPQTAVLPEGASIQRDEAGLFIEVMGDRLRHGTTITGGGGYFSTLPANAKAPLLVPEACQGPSVLIYGLHRAPSANATGATVSPPPPPPSSR